VQSVQRHGLLQPAPASQDQRLVTVASLQAILVAEPQAALTIGTTCRVACPTNSLPFELSRGHKIPVRQRFQELNDLVLPGTGQAQVANLLADVLINFRRGPDDLRRRRAQAGIFGFWRRRLQRRISQLDP